MDKSVDRMNHVCTAYRNFKIKRIKAVDGVAQWGDGTVDEFERYNWNDEKLKELIRGGVITDWYKDFGDFRPPEVACSVSHRDAIIDFYNSNEEVGIIIEDDTEPVNLSTFVMPQEVDFYCLLGSNHPGRRVDTYENGDIKNLRNLSGYAITKRGASLAIEAMESFWSLADTQISFSLFKSVKVGTILPTFKTRSVLITAKAPIVSLVGLSKMSENTTFTCSGKKKWMPAGWASKAYSEA
jgi:GR25 family glycosyltransferase involved in LPS biosynthesis